MNKPTGRPWNIEFTGTPEAGKTTQLKVISSWLREKGFHVVTVRESAEIVPTCLKKGSVEANRWMRLKTMEDLICANASNADFVISDRGLIDGFIWQKLFLLKEMISLEEDLGYKLWATQVGFSPDIVFHFHISPNLSIERRGGEGKITTRTFVEHYNSIVNQFFNSYPGMVYSIDASQSLEQVSNMLKDIIQSILLA